MGEKMSRAPVYFTIMQVQFNSILALETYVPTIQDSLRKSGFPDFQKAMVATFNLNLGNAPQPSVPVEQLGRYVFLNIDKTAGYILENGALSFQTTEYDVFETFTESFFVGLRLLHEAVDLSYTDRVGFRYLDAVFPDEDESLSDYLQESSLGLCGRLPGSISHAFTETLVRNEAGGLTSRVIIQNGQLGFPPDLQPMQLTLPERFNYPAALHAVLDNDGFYAKREKFDLEKVRGHLMVIHDNIRKAFDETVTPKAIATWS